MSKFCPNCGEELVDAAKFCKNCGANLGEPTNNNPNPHQFTPPVVENDHTLALIVGIIFSFIIPIIGIVIGVYLYTRKDSSKAKTRGIIVIALGLFVWIVSAILSLRFY